MSTTLPNQVWRSVDFVHWEPWFPVIYGAPLVPTDDPTIYTLPFAPDAGIALWRQHWRLYPGLSLYDYDVSGIYVTLAVAPLAGDHLWANFTVPNTLLTFTTVYSEILTGTVGGGNVTFNTAVVPLSKPSVTVGRWPLDPSNDFTWTPGTTTITLARAPLAGELPPMADYSHA